MALAHRSIVLSSSAAPMIEKKISQLARASPQNNYLVEYSKF